MENQIDTSEQTIILSEAMMHNLRKVVPWMKFSAIMTFISAGFLFLTVIVSLLAGTSYRNPYAYAHSPASFFIIIVVVYIPLAFVMIALGSYLFKQADRYSKYIQKKENVLLEEAFLMQKKYWQTIGIMAIVLISLFILILLMLIATGLTRIY